MSTIVEPTVLQPGQDRYQPTITTVAGTGVMGFSGDGGPAINAQLHQPVAVSVDHVGDLYVVDQMNYRVRKIDTSGRIVTVAGSGQIGSGGDHGPATSAELSFPFHVAVDPAANIYIPDAGVYGNRVRKVNPFGVITTAVGNSEHSSTGDGGPAVNATVAAPCYAVLDARGNLYIAEDAGHRVRKVDPNGVITTVAGNGQEGFSGDGGPAVNARLNGPAAVFVDNSGNLYIADRHNHRIRKVNTDGVITTVAGNGQQGFSGDGGPAVNAQLNYPFGILVDPRGNLYIADNQNHRIRKVDTDGVITTVVGTGQRGFSGDGGPAINAQISPTDIAMDARGNLYIADPGNHRVRMVTGLAGVPDVKLVKEVTPQGPLDVGDVVTYRITATNEGTGLASQVRLTDAIPPGTTYLPGSLRIVDGPNAGNKTDQSGDDQAWFDANSNQIVVNLGAGATAAQAGSLPTTTDLPTGTTVEFRVAIGLAGAGSTITNRATATYVNPLDNAPQNQTATSNPAATQVNPAADLSVTKAVEQTTVTVGQVVTYQLVVRNAGPSQATGVTVTDAVPAGIVFLSANASSGTYTPDSGKWTIGTLAVGTTATLTLHAKATTTGSVVNTATVTGNEKDPGPSGNTDTSTVCVRPAPTCDQRPSPCGPCDPCGCS